MQVVSYSPGSWWYLLQHKDHFFLEVAFEYFGTTKSHCLRLNNEMIMDPLTKTDPVNKIVFVGQANPALSDVIRTAEYLSRNLSPSARNDLENDLLMQIQQAIANLNKSS